MSDFLRVLIPSAVGFVTAVCAAFVTARWAVRRAFEERWWARKEQVYTEIIEALHDLLRYAVFSLGEHHAGRSFDGPSKVEISERHSEALWKVQKMTDIGAFVISDDAAAVLMKLRERQRLSLEDDDPITVWEMEGKHYREALDDMRTCARRDLMIDRPSIWPLRSMQSPLRRGKSQ